MVFPLTHYPREDSLGTCPQRKGHVLLLYPRLSMVCAAAHIVRDGTQTSYITVCLHLVPVPDAYIILHLACRVMLRMCYRFAEKCYSFKVIHNHYIWFVEKSSIGTGMSPGPSIISAMRARMSSMRRRQ